MRRRTLLYTSGGGVLDVNYLKFTANGDCQVKFMGTTVNYTLNTLQYSTDKGDTWSTLPNDTYISINTGDSVIFKGICTPGTQGIGTFASTGGTFNVSGNVMSLLFGNRHNNKTDLTGYNYAFYQLFKGCLGVANIDNLVLPATTLASNCYNSMFNQCKTITKIPNTLLPATTLANGCYNGMFINCFGLTEIPSDLLPATTLANNCYSYMFGACHSLTAIPSGLLPATTLANSCYNSMFSSCDGLTTVPSTLLPATTLANSCYFMMFNYCTLLTTAPDLPATTLVNNCYGYMFGSCSKLKYIKAMFTTTPDSNYTSNWVRGVASSGTFVKNRSATWNVTGDNGVPSGWAIQRVYS